MTDDSQITYIGRVNHRNVGTPFGIRQRDRRSHFYVIGKTGTGKSHLLRCMVQQDIAAGRGCALFDPHGDLSAGVHAFAREHRPADIVYVEVANRDLAWRLNPFEGVRPEMHSLVVAQTIDVFKKIWEDEWGPRLEHLFRNVIFTLLEMGGSLLDVGPLLTDKDVRQATARALTNVVVRDYWLTEYERYSMPFRAVVAAPLQNKLGALLTDPVVRKLFTDPGKNLDLRSLMDEGKLLIVNLDKGRIGAGPATLIGSVLLSRLAVAALSRSDQEEAKRKDFFVYLDEFQNFTTLTLVDMMAELRKYRLGLVLAHQHLAQLEPAIRDAVFGNVGTIVALRVGAADGTYLAREFAPKFDAVDLTSLPRYSGYVRLQIDGAQSGPFSLNTLETWPLP